MAKKYQAKSQEQINEELDKLLDNSLEQIKKYSNDPKEMMEYAKFISKIHNYSTTNLALIDEQFKGARAVASFQSWSKQGFRINKGEKGIEIYAFTPFTKFVDKNGVEKSLKYATPLEKKQIKNNELKSWLVDSFKKGHVYDISQTNATEKDLPKIFPNKVWNFDIQNDHDIDTLEKGIHAVANSIGIEVKDMKDGKLGELGAARGAFVKYVDGTQEIVLNSRNSRTQNLSVGIHELAHAKLHSKNSKETATPVKEFQAELTSFIVSYHYGMDTSESAIPYIAAWTKNGEKIEPKEMRKVLDEVKKTAVSFIEEIDNEILKERDLNQEKVMNSSLSNDENESIESVEAIDKNIETLSLENIVNENEELTLKNTFETENVFKEDNSKINEDFFKRYENKEIEIDNFDTENIFLSVEAVPETSIVMNGVTVDLPYFDANKGSRTMYGHGLYYRDMIEYYEEQSDYSYIENINNSQQTSEYTIGQNKLILDHACNEILYLDKYGVTDKQAKNDYSYEVLDGRTNDERKYVEAFLQKSTIEFEKEQNQLLSQTKTISNSFSNEEISIPKKENLHDVVLKECSYNLSDKSEIYYDKNKWSSEMERQTSENIDSFDNFQTLDDPKEFYEMHKEEIEETINFLSSEHGIDRNLLISNDNEDGYEEAASIFTYQVALTEAQNSLGDFEIPEHPRLKRVEIVEPIVNQRNEMEMA